MAALKILLSILLTNVCSLFLPAHAEPLQGYAESHDAITRIQRLPQNKVSPELQENANQDSAMLSTSLVNIQDFNPASQVPKLQSPSNNQQVPGNTDGGQDESWMDWKSWERRVETLGTRIGSGTWLYTDTYVYYSVTRNGHIKIVGAKSPDPTGKSVIILSDIVKQFEGNPVLQFPAGSKQAIHYTSFFLVGPPGIWPIAVPTPRTGQVEHTVRQW